MLPDSIDSLHRLLDKDGIQVILVGGWAVNEHGYSRETRDIDWIASETQQDSVTKTMLSAGFEVGTTSGLVTRFFPPSPALPVIDFLWVDPKTFTTLDAGKAMTGRHNSLPLLRLDHLIAMKIHALKNNEERKGRDLIDIRYLLEANPGVISDADLQALCSKFGPDNAYELISNHGRS